MPGLHKSLMGFLSLRRFWKPAIVSGVGGTAVVIWLEDLILFTAEVIGVIFLPILAGILYLYNAVLFRSFKISNGNIHHNRSDLKNDK